MTSYYVVKRNFVKELRYATQQFVLTCTVRSRIQRGIPFLLQLCLSQHHRRMLLQQSIELHIRTNDEKSREFFQTNYNPACNVVFVMYFIEQLLFLEVWNNLSDCLPFHTTPEKGVVEERSSLGGERRRSSRGQVEREREHSNTHRKKKGRRERRIRNLQYPDVNGETRFKYCEKNFDTLRD
ncbi:hypothetical protein TNIN_86521 [Trichonephila inaurata madagascariensis]|uniref:Uncharacterized protein n=1 Tax=Trichonephila inaurata madagascariensis TaxID=2747483 RepID=A0A8X6XYR6_9ARAC|nr:hypothetical protein TNIN_86521 [Trichonephila inaurata madagascariensis]